MLDATEGIERALVGVFADELNTHAATFNGVLNAFDAAASLQDVRTSVAAIADIPERTMDDFKTGVRSKLGQ